MTACGAQNGASGMPQAQSAAKSASGSYGDLLYVSMNDRIWVLTYPALSKVAEITYFHGNITASDPNNGNIVIGVGEYAHGGTQPFAYLELQSGEIAGGVAFDPTTDNIAYSIDEGASGGGWIAVYRTLNDPPKLYTDPDMSYYGSVVYDSQGNLFVLGTNSAGQPLFAELPKGTSTFVDLTSKQTFDKPYDLLWDGQYVVVRNATHLFRVTVSGSTLNVVGKTSLKEAYGGSGNKKWPARFVKIWIQGEYAIAPRGRHGGHRGRYFGLWHYPQGGPVVKVVEWVSKSQKETFSGATVSVGSSR